MTHHGNSVLERAAGRRQADMAQPRERRRAPVWTQASAQSVVMARLSETPAKAPSRAGYAAQAYVKAAAPQKTAEEIARADRKRAAAVKQQAAQRAWGFERRKAQAPRASDIMDAEIVTTG